MRPARVTIDEVIAVVKEAGDIASGLQSSASVENKADNSPVSNADRASNELIEQRLAAFGYPIRSEEDVLSNEKTGADHFWLVDPLDGTLGFLAGRDDWSVMVGLVENHEPVLGVVYAPRLDKLWSAEKGSGTFLTEKGMTRAVHVSSRDDIRGARALMSFSHASETSEARIRALGAEIQRMGSAGVKIGMIAEGLADIHWSEGPLREWDLCAPQIILEEAGGRVSDMHGNRIFYEGSGRALGGCAASNSLLHSMFVSTV